MNTQEEKIKATFDSMAANYDKQWVALSPLRDSLHLLIGGALSNLPEQAKILVVGAGTGEEILYLAGRFPNCEFTAVDPSEAMIEVCRNKVRAQGFEHRCQFHVGYVDSLSHTTSFDAATALLVSQFIIDPQKRANFFKNIAQHLKPGGTLINSELSANMDDPSYNTLLSIWLEMMRAIGTPQEGLDNMRSAYGKDVALTAGQDIEKFITQNGFETPVQFYQSALIRAWISVKQNAAQI